MIYYVDCLVTEINFISSCYQDCCSECRDAIQFNNVLNNVLSNKFSGFMRCLKCSNVQMFYKAIL